MYTLWSGKPNLKKGSLVYYVVWKTKSEKRGYICTLWSEKAHDLSRGLSEVPLYLSGLLSAGACVCDMNSEDSLSQPASSLGIKGLTCFFYTH